MPPTQPPLTPAQVRRSQELVAQIVRLLSAAPRVWDVRRLLETLQALDGEARALDLKAFLASLDRFRALLGTAGSTPESIAISLPLLSQAAGQLQHALDLVVPPNPFSRGGAGGASNQVSFDQVTTPGSSVRSLANQAAARRSSSQLMKLNRERLVAESIARDMPGIDDTDDLPIDPEGLLQGDDFLVEDDLDDEVVEDFDAFLEEEIAGNSIFSPGSPHKPQLLPEARSVQFQGSGLLMVFDHEADVSAALARSRAEGPLFEADEVIDVIDIDIQPVEQLTDVERAMRSLVDRLSRILTRLLDTLDLLLVGKTMHEAIDVARQLNRIARIVGLFQLDNHLPMIAYLHGLLPLTVAPGRSQYVGGRERLVDPTQSARFLNQQQELLAGMLTLVGWLIEDIPGLDREHYESAFLSLYDTLGWSPGAPSDAAPTRQGWAQGQVMEKIARQVYAGIQETLDGISRSLLDGQPEGFQLATSQLRRMAEVLAGQQISDAVVHLSRLAELFRSLRPISPPVEQILSRFEALLSALGRWFPTLPLDGFRQHIRSLCNTFRSTQRQRTNPALAAPESLRITPVGGLPAAGRAAAQRGPQRAITVTRARTNTNEIATGLMQLLAKLDAIAKEASRAGQHHNIKPLLERLPAFPPTIQEARQRGLHALALALEVICELLKHTPERDAAPQNRHPITDASERLDALLSMAMESIERGLQGSPDRTPLGNPETFFAIDRHWPSASASLLQGQLVKELDQVLAGWRAQRHTQPASAVAAQFFLPEQHRPGIERIERIAQLLGSEALSEALITHQHSLPSILQDENATERLERAIQRVERFAREALFPSGPQTPQTPSDDQLKFASFCRRWLVRAFDQPDPEVEGNLLQNQEFWSNMIAALLPRAARLGQLNILGSLCMLRLSIAQFADANRELSLRQAHFQRGLLGVARHLQLLAPDLAPDPTPDLLTSLPSVEPWLKVSPAPSLIAGAASPTLSQPPRLGVGLPPRALIARPTPAPFAAGGAPSARTPDAGLAELIGRLQQRAACLGRTLHVHLPHPWPTLASRSPSAWTLIAALEELASALVDQAGKATKNLEMTWTLQITGEDLSVSVAHNAQPLPLGALQEALDNARCLDAYVMASEHLLQALCSHPEAILSLGLGPALVMSAALLRTDQGALSLTVSSADPPLITAWTLSVRIAS